MNRTVKVYQAQLPFVNSYRVSRWIRPTLPRPVRPRLMTTDQLAHKLRCQIETVLMAGFWFCHDCDCVCERIEGEQGQPAHCDRCSSHRIEWNPPVDQAIKLEAV